MTSVLVTGANGFVGRSTVSAFVEAGWEVTAQVRSAAAAQGLPPTVPSVAVDDVHSPDAWAKVMSEIDVVVHLIGHAHRRGRQDESVFKQVNVDITLAAAKGAMAAAVDRFVFVSSIKAVGDGGDAEPLRETTVPDPQDAYGRSKLQAEQRLTEFTGGRLVIIRPPLVHGPEVSANFGRLLKAVHRGVPLPLASIRNQRSLAFVDNLADAIVHTSGHPNAAGEVFHVADGLSVSTPELLRKVAGLMDRSARLFPAPSALIRAAGRVTGRSATVSRLVDSLVVSIDHIADHLGWVPPWSLDEGLASTVEGFLARSAAA